MRIDVIVDKAIERLATKWGLKTNKKAKRYRSEVVRRAVVYAYLVDVLKVDPREAPDKAIEYLAQIAT